MVKRSPGWLVIVKIGLLLRLYLWVVFDSDRNLLIIVTRGQRVSGFLGDLELWSIIIGDPGGVCTV